MQSDTLVETELEKVETNVPGNGSGYCTEHIISTCANANCPKLHVCKQSLHGICRDRRNCPLTHTEICAGYRQGNCNFNGCAFRHPPICTHFSKGWCSYGDKCHFLHIKIHHNRNLPTTKLLPQINRLLNRGEKNIRNPASCNELIGLIPQLKELGFDKYKLECIEKVDGKEIICICRLSGCCDDRRKCDYCEEICNKYAHIDKTRWYDQQDKNSKYDNSKSKFPDSYLTDIAAYKVDTMPKTETTFFKDYSHIQLGPLLHAIIYSINTKDASHPLTRRSRIKIAVEPFARGNNRLAYYMKEEGKDSLLVCKKHIKNNDQYSSKNAYMADMTTQTVAINLAESFNEKNAGLKLYFLPVRVMEVFESQSSLFYAVENYIEGEYQKFTNNNGLLGSSKLAETISAFSHFTYHDTKGRLMVTDLQGVNTVLTDPVIHSTDSLAFSVGNKKEEGIKTFFKTHKCNVICANLELEINENQVDKTRPRKGLVDIEFGKLKKPCQASCGTLLQVGYDDAFCTKCKHLLSIKEQIICKNCKEAFSESKYDYESRGMEMPKRCRSCRLAK